MITDPADPSTWVWRVADHDDARLVVSAVHLHRGARGVLDFMDLATSDGI
jgi:hypothetical protein